MENIIQNLILVFIGLYILRYFLQKATINSKQKQSFISEYSKIMNEPQYKVKRSTE